MELGWQRDGEKIAVTLVFLERLMSLRVALLTGPSQDRDPCTSIGEALGAPKHDVELGNGLISLGTM